MLLIYFLNFIIIPIEGDIKYCFSPMKFKIHNIYLYLCKYITLNIEIYRLIVDNVYTLFIKHV